MQRRFAFGLTAILVTHASLAEAQAPFPGSLPAVDIGQGLPAGFEGSGAVFHPRLGRLFVVGDGGVLASLEPDGGFVETATIGGDLEGVTVADPDSDFLYLALENPDSVLEYDLEQGIVVRAFNVSSILTGSSNLGLEALAFVPNAADPEGGVFHLGQQSDGKVYVFRLPIASSATATTFTFLGSYAPLPGVTDISSLDYDPIHGKLYAVFDAADRLVELTPAGAFVRQWQMPGTDQEGIAIRGCELYAAEDTSTHLYKYFDFPSPASCSALSAQSGQISAASGGTVDFVLRAVGATPPLAGRLLLGSASGTSPGLAGPGFALPLNPDAYLDVTVAFANSPTFVNTLGYFDGSGKSTASLVVPPLPSGLAGIALDHAFLAFHPSTSKILAGSNAQHLSLVP